MKQLKSGVKYKYTGIIVAKSKNLEEELFQVISQLLLNGIEFINAPSDIVIKDITKKEPNPRYQVTFCTDNNKDTTKLNVLNLLKQKLICCHEDVIGIEVRSNIKTNIFSILNYQII